MPNFKRFSPKFELIIFFERHKMTSVEGAWKKLKGLGICSRPTFYRYHRRWVEADTKYQVLEKEFVK